MDKNAKQEITRLERAIEKSEKDHTKLKEKVRKHEKIVSETLRSIEVEKINLEALNSQLSELKLTTNQLTQ